jgi:myo-inositol-1(or 4)-monophosphatase
MSVSDIEVALAAASAGAAVVRASYGRHTRRHDKGGHDFATDVDIEAERSIMKVIAAARPGDVRVGEESGQTGDSSSRRWLVDPLCGTLNFAAQTPLVAINVALLDGSSNLASVSVDPIADEMFWTDGRAAFRRRVGVDEPLRPSAGSRLVDVNCDGPTDRPFVGPQLVADGAFRASFSPRVMSTTLAVAWVAAGRRAAYISDGSFEGNVHFAAGIGLCRGVGCVITDLAGGALGTGRGLVAAATAETHSRLIEIIQPHLDRVRG